MSNDQENTQKSVTELSEEEKRQVSEDIKGIDVNQVKKSIGDLRAKNVYNIEGGNHNNLKF